MDLHKPMAETMTAPSMTTERGDEPTEAMVEAAARALHIRFKGPDPDWPIGVDKNGYAQEPNVGTVPSWKWHYETVARVALSAARALPPQPTGDVGGLSEEERRLIEAVRKHPLMSASGKPMPVERKLLAIIDRLNSRVAEAVQELDLRREDEASATQWLPDDLRSTSLGDAVRALRNRKNAAEARVAVLEKKLGEMIHAYDNGGVQIASPEIGGHDDIPPHPWHEEWMHGARALSTVAGEEKS